MKQFATLRAIGLACMLCSSLFCFGMDADDAARAATEALFSRSDLRAADSLARDALRKNSRNLSALFVRMEVAHLRLDEEVEIKSALKICEIDPDDPRAVIAAGRLRELAGSNQRFVRAVPALRRAIGNGGRASDSLKFALVAAAADGAPELDLLQQSREYGLLTDWKIRGPFGKQSATDFDKTWPPEKNGRSRKFRAAFADVYEFADGAVTLGEGLNKAGVYYAEGEFEIPSSGTWRLRLQTLGTLDIFLDGKNVLRRDARSVILPEVSWQSLRMEAGKHKVLVKFLPSASPFRIAVLPPSPGPKKRKAPHAIHAGPESEYVPAALQYFEGDYEPLIVSLTQRAEKVPPAPFLLLLADAWTKVEEDPPEARDAYTRALQVCSDCTQSLLRLVELDFPRTSSDQTLRDRAEKLIGVRETSEKAREVAARILLKLGESKRAAELVGIAVDRHPSIANLRDATLAASAAGDQVRANALATRLASSSAGAMALAKLRLEQGRHKEAASALKAWANAEPLNRPLWHEYARNLLLAEEYESARASAEHLIALSPDSAVYKQLLRQAIDRTPFSDDAPDIWYANYRRNTEELLRHKSALDSSTGVVQLVDDRAWYVRDDGTIDEYVHTFTRFTTRAAIIQNAELALPEGIELLTLRTLQADGHTAEPEIMPEKASVSMPGLTPGAAIDFEYTVRHAPAALRADLQFSFGSTSYPVERSRLIVLANEDENVRFATGRNVPRAVITRFNKLRIYSFEKNNITSLVREPAAPKAAARPSSITLQVPRIEGQSFEKLAAAVQSATRIGPRTKLQAARLRQADQATTARNIYDYVRSFIVRDEVDLEKAASAETTLALHRGNRTAALIAIGRAAGFEMDLVLAADYLQSQRFDRPLVRMRAAGRDWIVDVEDDSLAFGTLTPDTYRRDAVVLNATGSLDHVALPAAGNEERSVAQGDIRVAPDGTLQARIQIALGMTRGNELRRNLRTMTSSARLHFLEDIATRIIPGVVSVKGQILNETSAGPVTILVECRTNNLLGNVLRTNQPRRLQQLVPGLGLRGMYASRSSREQPIAIDSVLFETTRFNVTVPNGMELRLPDSELALTSGFGTYASRNRKIGPNTYQFTREFNIPMQVIEQPQYETFKKFAEQIDDAEKSQLQVALAARRS